MAKCSFLKILCQKVFFCVFTKCSHWRLIFMNSSSSSCIVQRRASCIVVCRRASSCIVVRPASCVVVGPAPSCAVVVVCRRLRASCVLRRRARGCVCLCMCARLRVCTRMHVWHICIILVRQPNAIFATK